MSQTLNVEARELLARADELEEPMPTPPQDKPGPACQLSFVVDAASQLDLSVHTMGLYLSSCQREWRKLAQSLRNAAKAYEEVDDDAADAVTDNTGVAAASVTADGSGPDALPKNAAVQDFEYPYYEVRQAATEIEAPDQGVRFTSLANHWDSYQRALQQLTVRFRPFIDWDGDARAAVEANFQANRSWIMQMVQLCSTLAAQAKAVVAAHKWAITEHPSSYDVSECDKWYMIYSTDPARRGNLPQVMQWYADLQKKSEDTLAQYTQRAGLPLQAVNPPNPPSACNIDPPEPVNPDNPDDPDYNNIPSTPTTPTTPATPAMPKTPQMPDPAALASAWNKAAEDVGEGLKPASVGGAGGGGIPSMPLQSAAMGPESTAAAGGAAAANAAARDMAANLGKAGAGMGGGMGMPMGAPGGGAGQGGDNKAKKAQSGEESLYSEDREWTEAVIGNRRRKDVSDK